MVSRINVQEHSVLIAPGYLIKINFLTANHAMILSIQSQVVYGCVGNQAASHVAHILDKKIACIPTGLFSNHKGHKHYTVSPVDILLLVEGLKLNGLFPNAFDTLLIGFLGTVEIAKVVFEIASELKELNPKCILILDPVMGDNARLYVDDLLVDFYKNHFYPIADIVVPNEYEDKWMSSAVDPLFKIITSRSISDTELGLEVISKNRRQMIPFPEIKGSFCGTGDIFAAILACTLKELTFDAILESCHFAINSLQNILKDNLNQLDLTIKTCHLSK